MALDKGKLLSGAKAPPNSKTSRPDGSHVVTLDSNLSFDQSLSERSEFISSEYHLTARIENSQLSQRDLSLLLDVLNFQIVTFGANFQMVLAATELYLRLTGGRLPHEISDPKIRLTVSVTHILIKEFHDSEYSLYSGDKVTVSPEIRTLLQPYLMSKRTYGSRFRTWRPEKFIKIKAVPVSVLFERTSQTSQRYSGYCKGYGESHGNAHRKKTKPSIELDGEDVPDKSERNLILRMTDPNHQPSNSLWIKYGNLRS